MVSKENEAEKTQQQDKEIPLEKLQLGSTTNPEVDDKNTIEVSAQITLPPDGGWGWMVVLSSFFIYAISDGTLYTFGSTYRFILTDLDLSPASVSLINSISVSSSFIFGPPISAFINRYGFRLCVMVGSAITSISYLFTFIFGDYVSLLIFYGLLAGFGYSMINIAALVVVGFYFHRLRGIAFAISVTGGSIGIMLFSLLYSHMAQVVGWRYTVMIQASLLGLCYFFSMTYRPLLSMSIVKATITADKDEEPPSLSRPLISKISLKSGNVSSRTSTDAGTRNVKTFQANVDFPTAAEVISDMNATESLEKIGSLIQMTASSSRRTSVLAMIPLNKKVELHERELERVRSLLSQVPEEINKLNEVENDRTAKTELPPAVDLRIKEENTEDLSIISDIKNKERLLETTKNRKSSIILDGERTKSLLLDANKNEMGGSKGVFNWEDHVAEARPLYRDDAFLTHTHSVLSTVKEETKKNPIEYQLKVSRVVTTDDLKERKGICTTAFKRVLVTMVDIKLLKRKSCLCVCISMLLYYAAYLVPVIFVTDRGRSFGIPLEYRKWFLSAVGFSGIFGRFIGTFIAMRIHPIYVLSTMFMTAGVSTLLSIFGSTAALQLSYCTILGLCSAPAGALRSVIFAKLYGLENLTNCTGLAYLFQGIGCLVSPPFAGWLKEIWEHIPFIFSGFCFIVSGLLLLPVPSLVRKENEAALKNGVV